MKHYHGRRVFVDSVGVRPLEIDPFVIAVMAELELDVSRHRSKSFDALEDTSFELVITLTPEAQHRAVELTRTNAVEVEYWPTFDPTAVEGNREARIAAYREVRDAIEARILARFPLGPHPAP